MFDHTVQREVRNQILQKNINSKTPEYYTRRPFEDNRTATKGKTLSSHLLFH